jgi:sensor histidine kinase YesM
MQQRFAGRVTLAWNVADDALEAQLPTLLLQPLLENAFKHGVERSRDAVRIAITAEKQGQDLCVVISNSESTLSTTAPPGIGLRNCRERLELLYGPRASLQLLQEGGGVTARLAIPHTA